MSGDPLRERLAALPHYWATLNTSPAGNCEEFVRWSEIEAALRAVPAREEWQPVATAPRDGTRVLVALIGDDGWPRRVRDAAFNGFGWYTTTGEACHWRSHWAPMPRVAARAAGPETDDDSRLRDKIAEWKRHGAAWGYSRQHDLIEMLIAARAAAPEGPRQPLDARAHAGDGETAAREAGAPPEGKPDAC